MASNRERSGIMIERELRDENDELRFKLNEYETAPAYEIKAVLLTDLTGMPGCVSMIVETREPLKLQPGAKIILVLPKEG